MSSEPPPLRPAHWLWLAAMAVGPGLALWAARQPAAFILKGELAGPRGGVAPYVAASVGLLVLAGVVVVRRAGWAGLTDLIMRWRWLAALPLVPLLRVETAGLAGPLAPLLICLLGAVVAWSVYGFSNMSHRTCPKVHVIMRAPAAPALALTAAAAAVLVKLSELAVLRHHALVSRVFDLGIYDNLLWNTLHGRPLACAFVRGGSHVTAHVDPVLVLLTPFYALAPGPETLLVLQAAAVLSGAAPVYAIALRRLGRPWLALVLGLAYLLHPAVHGTILFDVHSLAFAAPLCLWALYFMERAAPRRYALMVALLLLTREDVALLVCGLGLYAALGRGQRRLGLATLAAGVAYFVAVKLLVQVTPYQYARRYEAFLPDGEGGFAAVAASLITNPAYALVEVLTLPKLVYLAVMLAPLLLLPLLAGSMWWTFGFGLAFTLLASNAMNFSPLSHHTVMLFPVFFAAAPAGIERVAALVGRLGGDPHRTVRALGLGVLVASVLATWRLGALVDNSSFRGWPHAVPRALDEQAAARHAWLRAAAQALPRDASLAVTNHVGAHFSARDRVALYPETKDADYLVLHRKDLHPKGGAVDVRRFERRGYTLLDRHGDEIFVFQRTRPELER